MDQGPTFTIPENPVADAKDALRAAGIVTGPDRYGNWFVPCGEVEMYAWKPGDPVTHRVLVRTNGALAATPLNDMYWNWLRGGWDENTRGISENDLKPEGEVLPCIY